MSIKFHNSLIKKAKKILEKSNDKFRHVSFIVDGKKVICEAKNSMGKTHAKCKRYCYGDYFFPHSEFAAILKFPYRIRELKDYSIYNVRIGYSGVIKCSMPCQYCVRLLMNLGIKDIWFTNHVGNFERLVI